MVNLRLVQTWIQTENTFTGKFCNPAQYLCNPIWAVPISVPCETHQTWNLKGIDVLHLKENRPCSMVNVKRWTKGKRMHLMDIRYTEWYDTKRHAMVIFGIWWYPFMTSFFYLFGEIIPLSGESSCIYAVYTITPVKSASRRATEPNQFDIISD